MCVEIEVMDPDQDEPEFMAVDLKTIMKVMNSDYDCDSLDFDDGYHIEYDMGLS